jgi:hypothetical protein
MVFAAFYAHGISPFIQGQKDGIFSFPILFYLILFAIIMGIGMLFYKKNDQ